MSEIERQEGKPDGHPGGCNEEKRKMILQALEKACRDKRFHEVKLDDVAQIAGVGKGTIYRYFTDKEDLFFQLMTHSFDALCEKVRACAQSSGRFEEKLLGACTLISDFFSSRHDLLRLIGEQELRFHTLDLGRQTAFEDHRRKLRETLRLILEEGHQSAFLRQDQTADFHTRILMGLLRARNHGFTDLPALPSLAEIIDTFMRGAGRDRRAGE